MSGGACNNAFQSECVGITNAADSLTVIEKLVFAEKRISLPELVKCLDSDWQDAEILRRSFIRSAPKVGNDDETADDNGGMGFPSGLGGDPPLPVRSRRRPDHSERDRVQLPYLLWQENRGHPRWSQALRSARGLRRPFPGPRPLRADRGDPV
ncbi:MAG: hypothetical protein IT210_23190 [Armatimonadetes bacterium]|nr:hypothetical protein [Armatimonadota bacterium]